MWLKWWGRRGGVVVLTSAERGPRLDHLRHATRIRHHKALTPVIDEHLLLTAGPANHCARLVNHAMGISITRCVCLR